ncbi:MAG: BamA/TamA family outer membrane protein [Burkholderiaceae bacterium]|nr:BamA/TamA family outer membrane protein [Burkholderiaceae bacterium]
MTARAAPAAPRPRAAEGVAGRLGRCGASWLATALLAGCAALGGDAPPAADTAATAAAARGTPPLTVTIDAPAPLRALLERHLDVVRLGELARGARLEPAERERLAAAAPAQVRELLQTEGYFDPVVHATLAGERLALRVDPGPRTTVGRVTVEVQGALGDAADAGDARAAGIVDSLRARWAMPEGAAFRDADWRSAKTGALARLRSQGYAAAGWAGTGAEVDTAAQRARLYVVADSGPLFRAGALDIQGLRHHDAKTVGHLAGFGPGTPLTETLLLDFQDRLRGAGLFDAVAVGFDPDPAHADAAPVQVRLGEAPRQVWTFGVGVSANTGPRGSVEHLHRRAFGRALVARNEVEWGRLRQAWEGEIQTHPLARQFRWLVGGAVERLESDDDVVLAQRILAGRVQNTPPRDRFSFVEVERSTRRLLGPERIALPEDEALAVTVNHHLVLRRIDDALLPTDGVTLSLQGNVGRATSTLGDAGFFSRLYARATVYRPLSGLPGGWLDGWYGQGRLELGQVLRPDAVRVPDSQQFRAGGDESVRGYAYRSLGPVVDGAVGSADALLTASVELARPISPRLPSVWGAVFVDAGNAAPTWREMDPAVGVGAGVRWRSPVGSLRLDLAWGHELQKLRLHFSVGIAL